jgi:hypothetical protein
LKDFLLKQSLAVRTFILPEVEQVINKIKPTYDCVQPYKTDIVEWLNPIVDLSNYYVYPTNGITEGLNWWYYQEPRSVWLDSGDYQWIESKAGNNPSIKYQSVPNSADGNFCDIPADIPVALDLAYVGSTKIKKIKITDNIEYVFYGLSKSFGVSNIRTGWIFSKNPIEKLESLAYQAKYYNYFAHNVAETIIDNFSVDYIHQKLENQQQEICKELNLNTSDSVWLATTTAEEYKKFRRKDNIARICLSGVYKKC